MAGKESKGKGLGLSDFAKLNAAETQIEETPPASPQVEAEAAVEAPTAHVVDEPQAQAEAATTAPKKTRKHATDAALAKLAASNYDVAINLRVPKWLGIILDDHVAAQRNAARRAGAGGRSLPQKQVILAEAIVEYLAARGVSLEESGRG